MEQKEHTALTFEKAKDLIAVKYGCKNWIELKVNIALQREFREEHKINESIALDQAAELHTMSLTSQLSSALESYNRECKRNDELQEEVDKLKGHSAELTLAHSLVKELEEEIKIYREALSLICGSNKSNYTSYKTAVVALSKFQPKKDETPNA